MRDEEDESGREEGMKQRGMGKEDLNVFQDFSPIVCGSIVR